MNQETDWRLQNQEAYLSNLVWEKKGYFRFREGWDHDHCEFCGVKFSVEAKCKGSISHGYMAKQGYYWICEQCFLDFQEQFSWKLISE